MQSGDQNSGAPVPAQLAAERDTRAPGFADEVRRHCRLLAESSHAEDDMAFVESVSWFNSEEAQRVLDGEPSPDGGRKRP